MKLLDDKKVEKFFNLLSKKERMVSKLYSVEGKSKCEKEVFVKRALRHLQGKHLVFYNTRPILDYLNYSTYSDENGWYEKIHTITCKRYISISNISFYLGYGEDLEIMIFDWMNYPSTVHRLNLNKSDCLRLEGQFIEDTSLLKTIIEINTLDLPLQEFVFKSYDWNKYPKRVKKGTDVMEKLLVPITVKAQTLNLAYKEIDKLKNKNSKIQYTLELWKK